MKKTRSTTKIIIFYLTIPLLTVGILYGLLPTILNYPPNSIDNAFQKEIDGLPYTGQFILISILCIFVALIILTVSVSKMNKFIKKLEEPNEDKQSIVNSLTKICVQTPIILYSAQILIPLIFTPLVLMLIGAELIVAFKISTIFILFFSLAATLIYVFAHNEFKKIIIDTYRNNPSYTNNIMVYYPKLQMRSKLLLELMPLMIIAIVFTSLLSYTMNTRITGDIYYKTYVSQLKDEFENKKFENINEAEKVLKELNDTDNSLTKFVITSDGECHTLNNNVPSKFFVKYALNNINTNRAYDYYCIDREGSFVQIETQDGNKYLIGVMYNTGSKAFLIALVASFIVLLFIFIIAVIFIANSLSKDTKIITERFNTILKQKDLSNKLIVTSNDETGELTQAFNQIRDMTLENIKEINEKQDIIVRQEKLSILGEMAGGMAHDINNPASAINMSIDILYGTNDEKSKKEILDNMKECVKRILTIVSSVRDQFRNIGNTKKETFDLKSVLKNIEIVIHNQLVKYKCSLNVDYNKDFKIFGEKNKLNQVLSNIIMNAILAYKENNIINGKIDVEISQDDVYNVIAIKDSAGGISDKIKDSLFSKIITTRGTQGTGLGLYLAKSIIEDEFRGKIYFETETGVGTTFYIKLKKVEE